MFRVRLLLLPLVAIQLGCAHSAASWTPETVKPDAAAAPVPETPAPIAERAEPVVIPEPMENAEALAITRDGAILTGLLGNQFIEVARLDPEISGTFIDEERAAFDPRILARISTGRDRIRNDGDAADSVDTSTDTGGTSSVQSLLRQVQRLNQNISAMHQTSTDNVTTHSGTVELEQYLPTGTLLFLSGAGENADDDGDGLRDAWAVGVSQPLLRGASLRANLAGLRQANNAVAQSEQEFLLNVMDIVQQIELGYWELALARDVLAIREFAVSLAEEQMRREEGLLSVGKALRGDVITASAERAAREADLAEARTELQVHTIELIRLMHPSDTPPWELRLDPKDPAEVAEIHPLPAESETLALNYRPELAQARLGLANLELDVLRARNARLPRLDVVGSYGDGRSTSTTLSTPGSRISDSVDDSYNIGLEFETGLPNRAENARYRRARLEAQRGEGIISQIEENIAAEVRRSIAEVNGQWQRLVATAEAVLSRQESVRVVEGRRDVGKATNLDVLQTQRDFIQAQVDDATARVRYVQALTRLYMAEGTLLERRGVSIDAMEENEETMQRPAHATE